MMERGGSEKRRGGKGGTRGAERRSYLATKLSCLMLVSDVAWSVLKELREEEYGLDGLGDGSTEKTSRARKETTEPPTRMLAYSRGLDVIQYTR